MTTQSKWTPGPWTVASKPDAYWRGFTVYQVGQNESEDFICSCPAESNARLIAQAPEMVEALKQALPMLEHYERNRIAHGEVLLIGLREAIDAARAILAKLSE